jgi:hypothetical protein
MQRWVEEECGTSDFGDQRLDVRFQVVLDELSQKPSASIPVACGSWGETNAAYRFFQNRRVSWQEVLGPHQTATLRRIGQHEVVLLIQDTTEVEVTRRRQQMTGAGPLTDESRWGFYDHPLLAVTPDRVPLGVAHAEIWARDLEEFRESQAAKAHDPRAKAKKHRELPIEEKESCRWLEGYRQSCAVAAQVPGTKIVAISDSEGDIYECFAEAVPQPGAPKAEWIVRACQDRCVVGAEGQRRYRHLWETVAATPVVETMKLEVREQTRLGPSDRKRNQPRTARTARLTIQAARVTLRGPQRPGGRPVDVQVNAILIREIDPPPGEEPVEWLLLTSLPINSRKKIRRVISYYCCRWQIEIYFKVLKSGCKVEERYFEDAEHFLPCLALYMVIAWRIMYVTMLGRQCPDMSCAELFSEEEWKAVYTVVSGDPLPATPPTLQEMLLLIARLGGHLGRTHDDPPGPKTMWIGMQRMRDLALAWLAFGPATAARRKRKSCV